MSKQNSSQQSYTPDVRKNKGVSPLWILPILTMLLAGWLVTKAIHDAGQRVQIYFSDAQGLVAGRTTIRYQGLEVGMVRDINLSKDLSNIYVDADIYPEATQLLNKSTRFWLVKPTASLSGISGLDALVSGNYIAIQPGTDDTSAETVFYALKSAPTDLLAENGLTITLKARDLGGVSIGSKIVYKKIPIGEVYSYRLADDGQSVTILASIDNEYRHIINRQSRFWNVSGIGASIGFEGVDVRLESMSALFGGAIAVDSPDDGEPVEKNAQFHLYRDLKTAGRGISVQIALPDNHNISTSGAPIMYRGIEVGEITNLSLSEGREVIIANAAIQPAFSDMLTSGSDFILEEAKLSLSGVENIRNLVSGNFLTIVPGEGEKSRRFTAIKRDEYAQQQDQSVSLRLLSESSYGLDAGASVLYKGITVGAITRVGLLDHASNESQGNEVFLDVLVEPQYANLIRANNRFFVTGSASAELTETGLSVTVPPAKQLLAGSISFISEGKKQVKQTYPLFQNRSLAELAKFSQSGSQTLTLFAPELPPITKGSPLLYRNLPVGTVADFSLANGGVEVKVSIENRYKHLINEHSVFWNRSGIEVDATLAGVAIKAAPLKTLLQGGIAFDTITGIENKIGPHWKLYPDQQQARKFGRIITFTTNGEQQLTKGMPIQYQGVKVGEITLVTPDFNRGLVEASARILPEYVANIAVQGSHFWLATPQIGVSGVKHLDALISKYIQVEPGKGQATFQFELASKAPNASGTRFTLQSEHRGSVTVGTPILYRDIEIGLVTHVQLGKFADRVVFDIEINNDYAYLVRQNSVFWNVSGVDVSIGLSGANIKAGSFDSIVRGGIALATPPQKQLEPIAKAGQAFFLYQQAEQEWRTWRTAIPRP